MSRKLKLNAPKEHQSVEQIYAFRIAPRFRDVIFFVEAKKPHGDLATKENYFQAIRYGWNSQSPLTILTSFNDFHILDSRYKPHPDTCLDRCVRKFHYTDYTDSDKFSKIYYLFSREAIAQGAIDKFVDGLPKPPGRARQRGLFPGGYQGIDESFLEELDEYRKMLARSFKNENPSLDSNTLTEITQRTIDRLVFIRFLEDKAIEMDVALGDFGARGRAWDDFVAACKRLNNIYNGVVFRNHDILDSRKFRVDESIFGDICESLARANSPYDFNAIPIHILGSIYERFLGKVIVVRGRHADIVLKPEVRKAGGVYYTPEHVVSYIIDNTVGKLIAGRSPTQISGMRFADIACGSGSFLLAIYDCLLRHHTKYYNENPGKSPKADVIRKDDGLHLSMKKNGRFCFTTCTVSTSTPKQ